MAELPELDPVVHGQIRLEALSILAGAKEAEFTYLRDQIGTTDGNLSVHLSKLEQAGYVAVKKEFHNRKPRTLYRISDRGRQALLDYVRNLRVLLGPELRRRK